MESATGVELDGQYRALREGAGWLDRSERGKLRLSGAEALEFLQGQLTNDVEALARGEGCYAALLDRKGHMRGDMRVLHLDSGDVWLDTEAVAADAVLRDLGMYKIGREVEIEDVSDEWAITSVIGPAAAEVAGVDPPSPEFTQRYLDRDGIGMQAVATDLGLDFITRAEEAAELRRMLADAGTAEVTEAAAEIVRVESGRPRFGREMTTETIPEEAGINERAVSFTKGCYVGQETVARLHYRGKPNRHLRGLRLEAAVAAGDPIALGDREVGRVGTAVLSPALGHVALAIVRREAGPADRVMVAGRIAAEVVALPF